MAYENLLKSVEENAGERERELREKAEIAIKKLEEEAAGRGKEIRQMHLESSTRRAMIERNQQVYLAKARMKEQLISIREQRYNEVFRKARERLASLRDNPRYPEIFAELAREAVSALDRDTFTVHVDQKDLALCGKVLASMNRAAEIVPDLPCAGGLAVSSPDGSVVISNTVESRLERGRERLKLEIYSLLFGE